MRKRQRTNTEVNAGSTADIAFLLLIFFLATTTILQEKGLSIKLPPEQEIDDEPVKMKDRNVFNIRVNSQNQVMINDEVKRDLSGVPDEIREFVLNPWGNKKLAESPKKAIISLKTNRGTKYKKFIEVLDMIKLAYFDMYGARVGLSADEFRSLDHKKPADYELYLKGKKDLPMNISIAEPTI